MATHDRPNGRPVHPECERLLDSYAFCTCELGWAGWDGTTASLRATIDTARSLEGRNIPGILTGAALASAAPLDSVLTHYGEDEELHSDTFWSRAEFLLTIQPTPTEEK